MTPGKNEVQESGEEVEQYPVAPRFHPAGRLARSIYDLLASAKLAMLLMVAILASSLCGGIFFRDEQARQIIFGSLWFNGFLVLLVINTACCFFGRIWGRRVTVISFGMILFHLSFVFMFLAIVFDSLFSFDGTLRMTEGETLSNRDPGIYDAVRRGLFFSFDRLKGETTLVKVHRGYRVDGDEKNIAYEIAITDGTAPAARGMIYINNKFAYHGVEYIRDREGYSLLMVLYDRAGRELYGAHCPLQSIKQKDGSYIYATGTSAGPGLIDFPSENVKPLISLQADYGVDSVKDRAGNVRFQVWPVAADTGRHDATMPPAEGAVHGGAGAHGMNPPGGGVGDSGRGHAASQGMPGALARYSAKPTGKQLVDGTVPVGGRLNFGEYGLGVREVRYWVAMNVRYNPGKPVVLAALWMGLAGLIITACGRILRSRKGST